MIFQPFLYKKIEGGGEPDLNLNGIELIFDTDSDIKIGMAGRNGGWDTYGTVYKWAIFLDGNYIKVEEGETASDKVITIPNSTAGLHRVTMLCLLENQDYCARSVCFHNGAMNVGSRNKLISAKGIGTGFYGTSAMPAYCYSDMFCETSLEVAPDLPAMTLAKDCYAYMFQLTNITKTPDLPAMTLANGCYAYMFSDTNITKAPALPATTLADDCYGGIYNGCDYLTEVSCHYPSDLSSTYANDWLLYAGFRVVSAENKGKVYSPNAVITYGLPENWEAVAL